MHKEIYKTFCERINQTDECGTQVLGQHRGMIGLDYPQFCAYVFSNWTPRNRSLKLTKIGFIILSKMYQCWKFEVADHTSLSTAKGQLFLQRHLKSPYYYDMNVLGVFNRESALEIEVASRDLQLWQSMFDPSTS